MWKKLVLVCCLSFSVAGLPAQSGSGYWVSEDELQFLVDSLTQAKQEIERLQSELLLLQGLFNTLQLESEQLKQYLNDSEEALLKAQEELKNLSKDLEEQRRNLTMLSESLKKYESEVLLWKVLAGTSSALALLFLIFWLV